MSSENDDGDLTTAGSEQGSSVSLSSTTPSSDSVPPNMPQKSRQYETARRVKSSNTIWACDRCYRLKSKCDSGRPSCSTCKRGDFSCSYTARERGLGAGRRRRRSMTVDAYVHMLEERLREVERILPMSARLELYRRTSSMVPSSSTPAPAPIPSPISHSPHPVAQPGMPACPSPIDSVAPPLDHIAHRMMQEDVIMDLLHIYFRYLANRWFNSPLHRLTFMAKPISQHSPFLIMTICAGSAPYCSHPAVLAYLAQRNLPQYRAGEPYYYRAKAMLPELLEAPNVDTTIGLLYLAIAATRMGEASAGQLLALSIRMAVGLRYDVDPDFEDVHPPASWLNKEMRRRLWWTLCAMEVTDCSLRDHVSRMVSDADQPLLDRIPVLHDSSRRVRAPAPDAMFESVRTEDGLPAMVPFRPGHDLHCAEQSVRLTRIFAEIQDLGAEMNRIVKDASSNAGRRPSHGAEGSLPSTDDAIGYRQHILRRQELERKLDAWLDQLPEWARNVTQHHVFTASTASQFPPPWQLVSVLLVYHECYVALYLPTLFAAYSGGLCPPPDDFHRLVSLHRYHCGKVSQIIEHVLRIDPSVMHVSLIGAYFTFYSSIALAVVMKTQYSMCQDDDVTPTPEQSEDMADLRKQFGLRVTWLKIFAESWYLGGYLASVVEGFMEDNAVQATV